MKYPPELEEWVYRKIFNQSAVGTFGPNVNMGVGGECTKIRGRDIVKKKKKKFWIRVNVVLRFKVRFLLSI